MSTEDMVKQDSLSQLRLLSEGSTTMSPGGFWDKRISSEADKPSNVSWSAANGLIAKGAGVSGQGAISFNPSGLWKPSKTYGQFKELFQTAGYSTKEMGPFASNGKWYKYSSQKMGDQVMRLVREAQPKLMYFGGEESARVRDRIAQEFPDRGTFTLRAKMKDGVKTVSKSYEYFLYPRPDGTHTVALFGPHPGAMGMASNRKIMEGTGEVAKALHEKGVLPEKVVHGEVSTGKG
jgi:hypothetical protein